MKKGILRFSVLFAVIIMLSGCKETAVEPPKIVISFRSSDASSANSFVLSAISDKNSAAGSSYVMSSSEVISSSSTSSSSVSLISSSSISVSSSLNSSTSGITSAVNSSSSTSVSSSSKTPEIPTVPVDPVQSRLEQMSLKEKVYQLFFVKPEQITGTSRSVVTPFDLTEKPVGGIICMGENLESVAQTKNMLAKTQESAMRNGLGVFFAVDEEGGRVARCALKLGTTAFEGMAVYGGRNDAAEAFKIGKTIGTDIRSLGFNVDFAPVADVDISPANELGNRIFSDDPEVVSNMVSGVVRGLNSSGVAATLKHFPGLGAEDGNTHTDTSIVINRTLEQLRSEEFVPFKGGIQAGAEFVMVGHQKVTVFGDDLPSDLSYKAVTEMLRGELGFDGIAITDAHNMNTISNVFSSGTAAVMAINAGIDMILSPDDLDSAVNAVYNAVLSGRITEERINESVIRILTLKQKMNLLL